MNARSEAGRAARAGRGLALRAGTHVDARYAALEFMVSTPNLRL